MPRSQALLVWLRFGPCAATDCVRLAKILRSTAQRALALRFSGRSGALDLDFARSDRSRGAPGLDFPSFWCRFSKFFVATWRSSKKRATSTKHWQGWYETHIRASMRQVENVKNRSAGASVSVRRHQRAANASRDLFRSVPERSWRAPARPKSARGGPGAPQERSGSASGALLAAPPASWWRPGASPNRPAAPRRLQDQFFNDFGSIFRRFLLDFPSIGLQCSFRFVLLMRWPGRSFWRRLRQRRPCNGPAIEHEKRETTRSNSAHARAHAKASRCAFVLRFAGRACLHNLHAPPHRLRHSALHGAPR